MSERPVAPLITGQKQERFRLCAGVSFAGITIFLGVWTSWRCALEFLAGGLLDRKAQEAEVTEVDGAEPGPLGFEQRGFPSRCPFVPLF